MKRILVCALAAMILMASCLTAFATSYNTTTSYVTDDNGNEFLEVTTNVTEATEGDMLTYLAYKDADKNGDIADGEVVYIDQKTVPAAGELNFSYRTSKGNLSGVDLKFGTSAVGVGVIDDTVPSRTYYVEYNGDRYKVVVPTAEVSFVITTELIIAEGEVITSALYEGTTVVTADVADGYITIADNADFNGGTIVITSEATEEPIDPPTINNDKTLHATFTKKVDDVTVETLSVWGIAVSDLATGWGGIIVSDSETDIKAYIAGTSTANVDVYPAYHKNNDGEFAVQLVNETGNLNLTNKTLYASLYVTNSSDTTYGNVITFPAK